MSVTVVREAEVKTRVEHTCHGCGVTIPSGCRATAQTDTEGGSIYTTYTCPPCTALLHTGIEFDDGDGCLYKHWAWNFFELSCDGDAPLITDEGAGL